MSAFPMERKFYF